MGNFLCSVLAVLIISIEKTSQVLFGTVIVYATLRVFEIAVYQANVLLFDEFRAAKNRKSYALRGYRRLAVLLICNYVEIIFWFAAIYLALGDHVVFKLFNNERNTLTSLYSSFIVMSTFGDQNIVPNTSIGLLFSLYQSAVGLFMTALVLARFFGILPAPKSSDRLETSAGRRGTLTRRSRGTPRKRGVP